MKIKLNPDQEIVNTIREGLKRTGGEPHADLSAAGSDRYGALQAPYMVRLLPDGNHDAGHLQAEKQRITKDNRKEPFSWLN